MNQYCAAETSPLRTSPVPEVVVHDQEQQIILAAKREDSIDKIVARALLAKLNFQAVGEEGEQVGRQLSSLACGILRT